MHRIYEPASDTSPDCAPDRSQHRSLTAFDPRQWTCGRVRCSSRKKSDERPAAKADGEAVAHGVSAPSVDAGNHAVDEFASCPVNGEGD